MIMQTNVNTNFKCMLNAQQKAEAHKEIENCCTRRYLTPNNDVDMKKVKLIFNKYFNPENPILDVNEGINGTTYSPLMTTVWFNYGNEAKELLKLKAIPRHTIDNSHNSIHIAATNGRMELIHLLLSEDPSAVDVQNSYGLTPLMSAIEGGHYEIVLELVNRYKANLDLEDKNKKTAIDYAKEKTSSPKIASFLQYYILESTVKQKDEVKRVNKI